MRVFRVEHDTTGVGPYQNNTDISHDLNVTHNASGVHQPWQSWTLSYTDDDLAGFASLEDLHRWFDGFTSVLTEEGYVVGVYESDDITEFVKLLAEDEPSSGSLPQLIFGGGKLVGKLPL